MNMGFKVHYMPLGSVPEKVPYIDTNCPEQFPHVMMSTVLPPRGEIQPYPFVASAYASLYQITLLNNNHCTKYSKHRGHLNNSLPIIMIPSNNEAAFLKTEILIITPL